MKKSLIMGIIIVIVLVMVLRVYFYPSEPEKWCHPVWEGKEKTTGEDTGISAHSNYQSYCTILETKEECEDSTDLVNYSIESDSFNEGGDGLQDCKWR